MKDLGEEIVDNDYILNNVTNIREYNRTIKDLKKDYLDEINESEEALLNSIGENFIENLKTGFPDKRKNLTKKIAYPHEYFKSMEDFQKPVDNLKKEAFFSK